MKRIYSITCMAVCILFFASCSKKDYATVIPADATFVAQVNLADLAAEADLKNTPAMNLLKGYVGLVASGDEREMVRAVLDDPSVMGIDFTAPAYIFETIDHCWGLVLRVSDSGDLENAFKVLAKQQLASKPTEKEDLMWTSLLGDINVAFDDHRLLILVAQQDDVTPATLRRQMTSLFTQEYDLSFPASENMSKLDDAEGSVAVYSRMAALPQDMAQSFAGVLPQGVRAADVEVSLSVSFDDGCAVLRTKMFSQNERVQKLFDESNEHQHKIQGEFLGAASDNFFAWVSMGCEGKWLLQLLKQNEDAKQALFMLERGIDIEQMLSSIDGDVTLVLPEEPAAEGLTKSNFIALAQLDNSDFLDDVKNWIPTAHEYGITLRPNGDKHFVMQAQDMQLQWGVEDKTLFFATPQASLQKAFSGKSKLLASYADEIKSSQFFALFNLQPVLKSQQIPLEAIVLKSEKSGEVELRLVGKDKNRSLLAQFLDMVSGLINF